MQKTALSFSFLLLIFSVTALAATHQPAHIQHPHFTAVYAPVTTGCSRKDIQQIVHTYTSGIEALPHTEIVRGSALRNVLRHQHLPKRCTTHECITHVGKTLSLDRIITSYVDKKSTTVTQRLGEEGADQYLTRTTTTTTYTITLALYDGATGEILYRKKRTAGPETWRRTYIQMFNELHQFFPEPPVTYVPAEDPPKTEETSPVTVSPPAHPLYLGGYLTFLSPLGKFKDYAFPGLGLTGTITVEDVYFPGDVVRGIIGAGFLWPQKDAIDAYYLTQIGVQVGYRFPLGSSFTIVPLLGMGYIIPFVYGDPESHQSAEQNPSLNVYYYPYTALSIELQYRLNERMTLLCTPSNGFMFSRNGVQHYLAFHAGLQYRVTFHD